MILFEVHFLIKEVMTGQGPASSKGEYADKKKEGCQVLFICYGPRLRYESCKP